MQVRVSDRGGGVRQDEGLQAERRVGGAVIFFFIHSPGGGWGGTTNEPREENDVHYILRQRLQATYEKIFCDIDVSISFVAMRF